VSENSFLPLERRMVAVIDEDDGGEGGW